MLLISRPKPKKCPKRMETKLDQINNRIKLDKLIYRSYARFPDSQSSIGPVA